MNIQLLLVKPQSQYFKQKEKLCCLSDTTWSEEEGMPRHTLPHITWKQLQESGRNIKRLWGLFVQQSASKSMLTLASVSSRHWHSLESGQSSHEGIRSFCLDLVVTEGLLWKTE